MKRRLIHITALLAPILAVTLKLRQRCRVLPVHDES